MTYQRFLTRYLVEWMYRYLQAKVLVHAMVKKRLIICRAQSCRYLPVSLKKIAADDNHSAGTYRQCEETADDGNQKQAGTYP